MFKYLDMYANIVSHNAVDVIFIAHIILVIECAEIFRTRYHIQNNLFIQTKLNSEI